jgi:subtilisin family serine protease
VTGKGVHVAIIDQPLLEGHEQYKAQLVQYTAIDCKGIPPQMHGPAVASLFVGTTCGVAPEASLHFWAEPSWKRDYQYRNTALQQIIDYNEGKPRAEQLRVVSVSKGFSPEEPNLDEWKRLLDLAESKGIYVIHCSAEILGARCPVFGDQDDPAGYQLWSHMRGREFSPPGVLYAPVDNRTTAHFRADDAYIFWSQGGLSWAAPFIAGVATLGIQENPDLTPAQIKQQLLATGTPFNQGKLINPKRFVQTVAASRSN